MTVTTVVMLMVFALPPNTQPVRPHEMLRFYNAAECENALDVYRWYSDHKHAYACISGVVVN